jgi:hypothetical protein
MVNAGLILASIAYHIKSSFSLIPVNWLTVYSQYSYRLRHFIEWQYSICEVSSAYTLLAYFATGIKSSIEIHAIGPARYRLMANIIIDIISDIGFERMLASPSAFALAAHSRIAGRRRRTSRQAHSLRRRSLFRFWRYISRFTLFLLYIADWRIYRHRRRYPLPL